MNSRVERGMDLWPNEREEFFLKTNNSTYLREREENLITSYNVIR
jgi:hypothetical protein